MGKGVVFFGSMIRFQALSEPVHLSCEFHKSFLVFLPLSGKGCPEWAGVVFFPSSGLVRL